MAVQNQGASAPITVQGTGDIPTAQGDLLITIFPRYCVDWHGTAAQLRAEGLVPDGFKWPERDGAKSWQAGGFHFSIERTRPPGMKAPKRTWINADYWWVRRQVNSCEGGYENAVYEAQQELALTLWRRTPEAQAMFKRLFQARDDAPFQAFLETATGLARDRQGRLRRAKQ